MSWNHKKAIELIIVVFTFILGASGCSTGPGIAQYPRDQIDRPLNLPEGAIEFEVNKNFGLPNANWVFNWFQPIPLHFRWSYAVSDRLSVYWFILPLGLKYQLIKKEDHQLAFEFFNHFEAPELPAVNESLSFTDRFRLTSKWDLEAKVIFQIRLAFKENYTEYAIAAQVGPRWQILPRISAKPWLGLLEERAQSPSVNLRSLSSGINLSWSPLGSMDIEGNILRLGFGNRPQSLNNLLGMATVRYRW